ncbi:hypothetical protein ZEAMMB73_Zm00001d036407 [Zea mays]|uniref:Uncharacterized protein n=1 Tax=Zea mays TaxID=4577 RepID=A0A1D6LMZ0_MAIZE|nr:hypothetical protein ZEAMMB73_Zm00001d036407 [Zea mays]
MARSPMLSARMPALTSWNITAMFPPTLENEPLMWKTRRLPMLESIWILSDVCLLMLMCQFNETKVMQSIQIYTKSKYPIVLVNILWRITEICIGVEQSTVVGKAVMLDEIINYVQSLQQQAEGNFHYQFTTRMTDHFVLISMKLATVNSQVDLNNLPNLLPKDIHQSCGPPHFSLETSGTPLSYLSQPHHGSPLGCMDNQSCMHPLDTAFYRQ